jgi:hypothetical protein
MSHFLYKNNDQWKDALKVCQNIIKVENEYKDMLVQNILHLLLGNNTKNLECNSFYQYILF